MSGETAHPIAVRQHLMWCLLFLFMVLAQPGSQRNKRSPKRQRTPFKCFEFEPSLENDLFCNVYRMDKSSFCALHSATLPSLRSKCRRPDVTRMPCQCVLSMTLSYLGGAHSCGMRVLCRPMHEKVLLSYTWNVVNSMNETFAFSFPLDARTLIDMETGFRSKSRKQVLKGCIGALDGMHFR